MASNPIRRCVITHRRADGFVVPCRQVAGWLITPVWPGKHWRVAQDMLYGTLCRGHALAHARKMEARHGN